MWIRVVAALLIVTTLSGCTSMHAVRAQPSPGVRVGDTVNLWARDGRKDHFKVAQITDTEILGTKGQRYRIADLVRLERRAYSEGRTVALGAVVAGVLLVLYSIGVAVGEGLMRDF